MFLFQKHFSKYFGATWQILARAPLVRGVWDIFPFKSEDLKSRLHMNHQNVTLLCTNSWSIWSTCQFSLNPILTRDIYTRYVYNIGNCHVTQDSSHGKVLRVFYLLIYSRMNLHFTSKWSSWLEILFFWLGTQDSQFFLAPKCVNRRFSGTTTKVRKLRQTCKNCNISA